VKQKWTFWVTTMSGAVESDGDHSEKCGCCSRANEAGNPPEASSGTHAHGSRKPEDRDGVN
jgi:hypothetical protein